MAAAHNLLKVVGLRLAAIPLKKLSTKKLDNKQVMFTSNFLFLGLTRQIIRKIIFYGLRFQPILWFGVLPISISMHQRTFERRMLQ